MAETRKDVNYEVKLEYLEKLRYIEKEEGQRFTKAELLRHLRQR